MNKNISDITFINHNLKNFIGAAYCHLQILGLEHPEFGGDSDINYAIQNLRRATKLSNDIAHNIKINTENKTTACYGNNIIINLNRHLEEKTKPIYEQLKKTTDLTINDTYKILDEDKYISINHALIMRFRENIISNAMKAGATKLDIHHEMKTYCGIATYIDNGKGMTQEELDKIVLSMHGDGVINGLGTQSIFKVAEEIGFHVSYTSVEGEGTTIRIIYPYVKQ